MNRKRMFLALSAFFIALAVIGGSVFFWYGRLPAQGIPILAYHMVSDANNRYSIDPAIFESQMRYLKEQGYTTISLLEYAKARKGKLQLPEKPIIITFDDGYRDNYTTAVPILEKYGMKGTVFMVANEIGRKGYLTLEQLKELERRNMEIGSHTANHLPLAKLTREEKEREIEKSKLLMEWKGLKTIFFLAYPNGSYDAETIEILKANEYLGALTGNSGYNTFETDPYVLHRINMPNPWFGMMEFKLRFMRANFAAHTGW